MNVTKVKPRLDLDLKLLDRTYLRFLQVTSPFADAIIAILKDIEGQSVKVVKSEEYGLLGDIERDYFSFVNWLLVQNRVNGLEIDKLLENHKEIVQVDRRLFKTDKQHMDEVCNNLVKAVSAIYALDLLNNLRTLAVRMAVEVNSLEFEQHLAISLHLEQ